MDPSHGALALPAMDELSASCAGVLGAGLVSAIVHGSLTQDDFRPGRSDLDLLLIVDKALSPDEAQALIAI